MPNITTENAAELLQPILTQAAQDISAQVKAQFDGLGEAFETRIDVLEKASSKKPEEFVLDLDSIDAVEAHLASLKESKKPELDVNDPVAVKAHLATLEKSKEADPKDAKIEQLERDLAKAKGGTTLRPVTGTFGMETPDDTSAAALIASVNSDIRQEA